MEQNTVYRPFIPMLMLAAAVVVWLGFATMQLMQERDDLQSAGEKQQTLVDQSTKLRSQLGTIAEKLTQLREQGNPGAREILTQLEKSGIKLDRKVNTGSGEQDSPPQPVRMV